MPEFWLVITGSGVLGLGISFTSMWFLHQTSATTYRYQSALEFRNINVNTDKFPYKKFPALVTASQ
jgi:hypothetical protein